MLLLFYNYLAFSLLFIISCRPLGVAPLDDDDEEEVLRFVVELEEEVLLLVADEGAGVTVLRG